MVRYQNPRYQPSPLQVSPAKYPTSTKAPSTPDLPTRREGAKLLCSNRPAVVLKHTKRPGPKKDKNQHERNPRELCMASKKDQETRYTRDGSYMDGRSENDTSLVMISGNRGVDSGQGASQARSTIDQELGRIPITRSASGRVAWKSEGYHVSGRVG